MSFVYGVLVFLFLVGIGIGGMPTVYIIMFQGFMFNLFFLYFLSGEGGDLNSFMNYLGVLPSNEEECSFFVKMQKFLVVYYLCEGVSDFLFLMAYLLDLKFLFMGVIFFKQGGFPFMIYSFLFLSGLFGNSFISFFFGCWLLFSKMWTVVVVSKIYICVDFYFFYVSISLLYLTMMVWVRSGVLELVGSGVVLNNLFLPLYVDMFSFWVVFLYEGLGVWFLSKFLNMYLGGVVSSGGFTHSGGDSKSFGGMLFTFHFGNLLMLSSLMKVFVLTSLFYYSFFLGIGFTFVISLFFLFSMGWVINGGLGMK